jgi:hypothetical protein
MAAAASFLFGFFCILSQKPLPGKKRLNPREKNVSVEKFSLFSYHFLVTFFFFSDLIDERR